MKLGLNKHFFELHAHDPDWIIEGNSICHKILSECGQYICDVQHVGSSSIPDVPSKPILDFVIGVNDMDNIIDLRKTLSKMNYIDRGLGSGSIGYLFVYETSRLIRTQHIHIVKYGSYQWSDYVLFRDYMRNNELERLNFKDFKLKLSLNPGINKKLYQKCKSDYVSQIFSKIAAQQGDAPERFAPGDL